MKSFMDDFWSALHSGSHRDLRAFRLLHQDRHFPSFIDIHDAWDGAICSLSVPTLVHPPVMKIYGHVWTPWRLITISRRNRGARICPLRVSLNYLSCFNLLPGLHILDAICVHARSKLKLLAPANTYIKCVLINSALHFIIIIDMKRICT